MRQFANRATTTLNGDITAGATSLTLASATGFPSAPFDLNIDGELMLVGARSGTSCTSVSRGQGGTSAAAHLNGATVRHALTAAGLLSVRPVIKRKTADTTYPTTAFVTDSHLVFPIGANEIWQVTYALFVSVGGTVPDLVLRLAVPSGATYFWGGHGVGLTASGTPPTAGNTMQSASGSSTLSHGMLTSSSAPYNALLVHGVVVNGATAGDVALEYGRNSNLSPSSDARLLTNSYVRAREVAA